MKTLLMAIDHQNSLTKKISQLTLQEAKAHQAAVVILCCIPAEDDIEGEVMTVECGLDSNPSHIPEIKDVLNAAELSLRAAIVPFQQAGIPVTGVLCRGEAAKTIVAQADKISAAMIIMGRRHLSSFNRIFKGSVSAAVLELASCPVLIDLSLDD